MNDAFTTRRSYESPIRDLAHRYREGLGTFQGSGEVSVVEVTGIVPIDDEGRKITKHC